MKFINLAKCPHNIYSDLLLAKRITTIVEYESFEDYLAYVPGSPAYRYRLLDYSDHNNASGNKMLSFPFINNSLEVIDFLKNCSLIIDGYFSKRINDYYGGIPKLFIEFFWDIHPQDIRDSLINEKEMLRPCLNLALEPIKGYYFF